MFDPSNQFNVFDKSDGHLLTVGWTVALIAWYANGELLEHCAVAQMSNVLMSWWGVYVECDDLCAFNIFLRRRRLPLDVS